MGSENTAKCKPNIDIIEREICYYILSFPPVGGHFTRYIPNFVGRGVITNAGKNEQSQRLIAEIRRKFPVCLAGSVHVCSKQTQMHLSYLSRIGQENPCLFSFNVDSRRKRLHFFLLEKKGLDEEWKRKLSWLFSARAPTIASRLPLHWSFHQRKLRCYEQRLWFLHLNTGRRQEAGGRVLKARWHRYPLRRRRHLWSDVTWTEVVIQLY